MRCRASSSFRVRRLVAVASLAVLGAERIGRRRCRAGPRRIRQPPRVDLQARRRSDPASGAGGALGHRGRTPRRRGGKARRAPRGSSTGPWARSPPFRARRRRERSSPSGSATCGSRSPIWARAAAALRAERIVPLPAQRRALRPQRQSRQRRGDRLRLQLLPVQVLPLQLRCREPAVFAIPR